MCSGLRERMSNRFLKLTNLTEEIKMKKTLGRVASFLLAAAMLFSLAACGSDPAVDTTDPASGVSDSTGGDAISKDNQIGRAHV